MKKLLSIITIVAVVVSSCTSSKNGLVLKRKYSKGYYVSHSHKANKEVALANQENKSVISVGAKKTVSSDVTVSSLNSIKEEAVACNKSNVTEVKAPISELKHNTVLTETKNETASVKHTKFKAKHSIFNIDKNAKKGSNADSDLIIQIILALFPILCLIAVYLKDGKSITNNFWLTLVLHLFIYVECIFAILVVLDIVNLA